MGKTTKHFLDYVGLATFKGKIMGLLAKKADKETTYTKQEVEQLLNNRPCILG